LIHAREKDIGTCWTRTECTEAIRETTNIAAQDGRLEVSFGKFWPAPPATQLRCRIRSARGVKRKVLVKFRKCDVGLCVVKSCLEEYRTKPKL
jgi:hypothetical protein